MKISESWLRDWINPALTTEQLAALLTMGGLEVDSLNPVAGDFSGVIVAEVVETKPHPQADRLTLCLVNTGKEPLLHVVCGAKNVRAGLKVALAQIGAQLPSGMEIKETKLRGELSQGMLCSTSELGLSESSEGIIELDLDAPVGENLREYLKLHDHILEVDLTPNRADCLSILGIAREVAAMTGSPVKALPHQIPKVAINDTPVVHVLAKAACPSYCARIIRGVNSNAITPLWLRERLRRSGIRSIHPVVDVTNYVMLELGQPMHAFNLSALQGDVFVRYAASGESLELLDGTTIHLSSQELVIADEENVLALAGVMGGLPSSVDDQTTDLLIESAFFTPVAIAGVARRFGLTTDSAQRFERGVDPALQSLALERATDLLLSIVGGEAGPIVELIDPMELPKPAQISFNPNRVKQLIGISLSDEAMVKTLSALGMRVDSTQLPWAVVAPTHRFDMALEVDLIEEIVRLHGYDNISQEKMSGTVLPGTVNDIESLIASLTAFFTAKSYHETITYSFVDPKLQELLFPLEAGQAQSSLQEKINEEGSDLGAQSLRLLNPISSELSSMRISLWPGLLASMMYNSHRQQNSIKLFESGVTFFENATGIVEEQHFAGLIMGDVGATSWLLPDRTFDFYDMKGDLQALFMAMNLRDIEFVPSENPALHPGKTAKILLDGQAIGWCGALHPLIAEALDITQEVLLFDLSLTDAIVRKKPRYHAISKFPIIRRDLSLLVDNTVNASDIEKVVMASFNASTATQSWLKSFDVFDVYVGESIPSDKKSLAVSLVLQDEHRTLVDTEINQIIHVIMENLKEKLAITWRE